MKVVVEADGGSRGNPGPAAYGAVVLDEAGEEVLARRAEQIGRATNNVAEYRGLIAGLEAARELGASEVAVRMDSKLVVEQMSGRWKVKHEDMRELASRAAAVARGFDSVRYTWVPREQNKRADAILNAVLDGKPVDGKPVAAVEGEKKTVEAWKPPASAAGGGQSPTGWAPPKGAPARLLLLRHGETAANRDLRCVGRSDPPLTPAGFAQAEAAARRIAARGGIAAVYSSPLTRTRQTAELVAKALGLEVRVDDRLVEIDFGEWEGLTTQEIQARAGERHARWLTDPTVSAPGGESFADVAARVSSFVEDVVRERPGEDLVAVTHVTPIKLALKTALGSGWEILTRLFLDVCSLSVVEFPSSGASSVRLVNDTSHWSQ